MNSQRSSEAAVELLRRLGIKKVPTPLGKVAKALKASLNPRILDEAISGFLYREAEKIIIAVNSLHPATRQRFTIAHECGHLVMEHKGTFFIDRALVNFRDKNSSTGEDEQEREANAFAAELLMPEAMIRRDLKKAKYDLMNPKSMEALSKKYQVSIQALTFRIANLGMVG